MSLWEIYKAKRLGYADDLWTSLIGHQLGGYSWQSDYETTPYLYRAMPNLSHYYNREIMEEVVGGSVGWNQLFPFDSDSWELLFGLSVSVNNGRFVLSGTASQPGTSALFPSRIYNQIKLIYGHKYLLGASGTHSFADFRFVIYGDSISSVQIASPATPKILNCAVQNVTDAEFVGNYINGTAYSADLQTYLTDLTLALGSTIADYVYSLEQATAGSGVAWLKEHFPKMFGQYNPYDAGSIRSVEGVSEHKVVGFNAWDEEWELGTYSSSNGQKDDGTSNIRCKNFIPVVPNTTYCISSQSVTFGTGYAVILNYDADKNYIGYTNCDSNGMFVTNSNARYITFFVTTLYGITYNHDICINLSDASRNGQYEPYRKSSYPLDSTLTLRGIPKLDNGKLYYDGDEYLSDGTVNRKYGVVDLGTLTWEKVNATTPYFQASYSPTYKYEASQANFICSKYLRASIGSSGSTEGIFLTDNNYIRIRDLNYTSADATAFKTAMSGVYLVYELASPTTETAQPFTKTQLCDSGGTEEFVTSGIVSVGHKSKYAEK